MENKINIIIADDHELFANGLEVLLSQQPGLSIVHTASNGKMLLDILEKSSVDMILLDINMPLMNGLDAAVFVKQKYKHIKIIALSTYDEAHLIDKAKSIGINGYLLKNSSKEDLINAINLVNSDQSSFPYLQPRQSGTFEACDSFLKQFNLTNREFEILRLIKDGFTNREISEKLFLSIYTVETHRKNIMLKLGIKKPVALIKFIIDHNI